MNPAAPAWRWKVGKHAPILDVLVGRRAPAFVHRADADPPHDEIPVFTFHEAEAERFERQCRFLADNGYRTVTAGELARMLRGETPLTPRTVALTFDDGLKTVWGVAWPILRRYGLNATCFLVPGCIPADAAPPRPTLDDVQSGAADRGSVTARGRAAEALASWSEIRAMHDSGVIEFQSHSLDHALVFRSSRLTGFLHPGFDPYYWGNIHIPLAGDREFELGRPLYEAAPRMQVERRFHEDERIRRRCVERVRRGGGAAFFDDRNWRRALREEVAAVRSGTVRESYEDPEQRDRRLAESLRRSREWIEQRLPGRRVDQLCFPWYRAAPFAVRAAAAAGFGTVYFGSLPGRRGNRSGLCGDGPLSVVRLDHLFVERLPGAGRRSLPELLAGWIADGVLPGRRRAA